MKKPHETITLRPQKGKLTLLDRRFFNVLLSHAQHNPVAQGAYFQISLSKFVKDAKYESRNMEHLANVLNHMMGTVVNWGDSAKNMKGPRYQWAGAPLISFARISKEPGAPTLLEYEFQQELRQQLLNPNVYATVSLELMAKMNTHAATVLLELGEKYMTSPNGLTKELPWREWAPVLTGNSQVKADLQFKYFARDVLKPALAQVNAAQELFEITVREGKVSRRVETLQFHVRRRAPVPAVDAASRLAEVGVENLELVGRMRNMRIPQSTAEELVLEYGRSRIKQCLAEMEPRLQRGEVKNPLSYLRKLARDGEFVEHTEDPVEDVEAKEVPQAAPLPGRAALLKAYCDEAKLIALSLFEELPHEEQARAMAEFEETELRTLAEPLQKAWAAFKPTWPAKRVTPFLKPVFMRWLARDELQPTDDVLWDFAARQGKIPS